MRRKLLVTMGWILLWALVVVAAVLAEAVWFAHPSVTRGDVDSIENHLVQKLRAAAAQRKLGSAALVLVQNGEIAAEHGFGAANTETQAPVKTDQTLIAVSCTRNRACCRANAHCSAFVCLMAAISVCRFRSE